jgi:CP family cyanate transporter-like MFS transporter
MTTAIRTSGKHGALLIAGILMIATTLRVTFTGAARCSTLFVLIMA